MLRRHHMQRPETAQRNSPLAAPGPGVRAALPRGPLPQAETSLPASELELVATISTGTMRPESSAGARRCTALR